MSLLLACLSCARSGVRSPTAEPSASPSLFDPYETPTVVAPTYIPPGYKNRTTFCEYARDSWAVEIGIFLASFDLAIPAGGDPLGAAFDQYARSARGLRDLAPDEEEAPYGQLADLRQKMYDTYSRYDFRWSKIPIENRKLVAQERRETIRIFDALASRCRLSPRHIKKGVNIILKQR